MVAIFYTATIIYFLASGDLVIKAELNEYPSRKLSSKFSQILLRSKYFNAFFSCAHIFFPHLPFYVRPLWSPIIQHKHPTPDSQTHSENTGSLIKCAPRGGWAIFRLVLSIV